MRLYSLYTAEFSRLSSYALCEGCKLHIDAASMLGPTTACLHVPGLQALMLMQVPSHAPCTCFTVRGACVARLAASLCLTHVSQAHMET